jgi:hypothetical protein
MKKIILFFLFTNFSIVAYNQVIKGTILEYDTNVPIIASIYFSGTFVGTMSDLSGNFDLDISKNSSMPLSVSSIGYYSVTITDFSSQQPLIIYLKPKVFEVNEVVISAESLAKRRIGNLNSFKKLFFGSSNNSRNCKIINENDLTFNYSNDRDTLKAFASKPLLINNMWLGYKITYYLDRFEYSKKNRSILFAGNLVFNEDLAIDESHKRLYKIRREESYLGSRMHLFRALWTNDLESDGFEVKNSANQNLSYYDIVEDRLRDSLNNQLKFLKYPKNIRIIYNSRITKIELQKEKIYFDKDGYFDQSIPGIIWEGDMLEKRVGDMLPYTYKMEK